MQNATMTFTLTGPDPLLFGLWRDLDARGKRIVNLADAEGDQDAVTLKQLQAAVAAGGGSGGGGTGGDAATLNGQSGTFYRNASNLSSGTVPAARLPGGTATVRGIVQVSDTPGTLGAASGIAASPIAIKAVSDALANKQDKVTKLAGTGITDVYTKTETNAAIQDAVASGGGGSGGGSDSAIQILEKLKTVDGGGSGLDADLLDGQSGDFYLDAANLTGTVSRDHLPSLENDPAYFSKTDTRTDSKLFYRDGDSRGNDVHAYGLTQVASPFNPDYLGGNYIGHHVRHVAEGTEKNGPRGAALGLGVSMFKEGFGTGSAKGGEIDAMYIVLRQDSPRNGAAGSVGGSGDIIPDRGDGCGILIDAAVYENVGFVGGIEGATSVLKNDGSGSAQRISYQIGCTDTTRGNNSFGYFASAALGKVSGGLLLTSLESAGAYFENFIQCSTDAGQVFQIDRRGVVSFGKLTTSGQTINPAMHMTLQADSSLGWINANRTVQLMNLTQAGDLNVGGSIGAQGANFITARLVPSNAAGDPSNWVAGMLSADGSGALRYTAVDGAAPGEVVFESEGTWTPQLRGSNGSNVSGFTASGTWKKIGGLVHVTMEWNITSTGSASGDLQISNMPFPRDATSGNFAGRQTSGGTGAGFLLNGFGGTANPTLLTIARYDAGSMLKVHAGNMSGTYRA